MAGFSKPGLKAVVARLHARHLRRNPAAREWRPGLVRRALGVIDRHSRAALALALATYAAVALSAAVVPAPGWSPDPPSVSDYFRDLQTINLGLFGAQAALLGLVYPLVIGLVGLLFEARSSRGNRLQVYFRETEALAVGGTSLALLMFMGLQLLGFAVAPLNIGVAATVLNVLWFTVNLGALGFFVVRSLDFMRPARRHALMKAFLANTAWSAQLRDGMLANQWANASLYGHLPAGSEGHALVMPFDFEQVALRRTFSGRQVLSDIRLGVLAAVAAARASECRVSFAPWPGITYDGGAVLARAPTPDLSAVERLLVRLAFKFSPPSRRDPPPLTEEILGDATADLLALMEAGRFEEFRSLLWETIELHRLLYALAQSPADPGKPAFSYAALKTDDTGSYAWEWARAYRDLMIRAGDHPPRDERYFESCAYIAAHVMREARTVATSEATDALFNLPATLFRALTDGAARRRAEAAGAPPPRGSLFTPTGSGAAEYRSAWLRFVGGWESLAEAIAPKTEASWEDLRAAWPSMSRHLHDSALRVAQAAKAGELQAIGWSVDMMLKWPRKMLIGWNGGHGYALVRPLITAGLLQKPWNEVAGLGLTRFDEAAKPAEMFEAVIENAWLDSQVVVACSLIGLMGEAGANGRVEDGPSEAAGALFRNQSFDPSASYHPRDAALSPSRILHAVLRLVGAGERFEEGYGHEIGALADEIDRLEGPNYISARIYSWTGEADVEGQAGLQSLLLAAATSPSGGRRRGAGVEIGEDLKRLLLAREDRTRCRLLEHLSAMRKAAEELPPERVAAVVATLRADPCTPAQAKLRIAQVVQTLEACEAEINAVRLAEITQAVIDPGRLAAIAEAASRTAFSKAGGAFPVALFGEVRLLDDKLSTYRYRLEANKARYTQPAMQEPVSNEFEWWEGTLQQFVGTAAFWELIRGVKPVRRAPRSAGSYWATLKAGVAAVQSAGEDPVIVRSSRAEPAWLSHWHYRSDQRPADMRIEQVAGRGEGYDFDINGVPIYSSPWCGPATWVFGRQTLQQLDVQRFDTGKPVEVTFEPDAVDVWKGVVVAAFGLRVTSGPGPIWRIAHQTPKAPDRTGQAPPLKLSPARTLVAEPPEPLPA